MQNPNMKLMLDAAAYREYNYTKVKVEAEI
jgi:hypothetical protein